MTALEQQAVEDIRGWITKQSGIHYPAQKLSLLQHRLGKVMRTYSLNTFRDLSQIVLKEMDHDIQLAVLHEVSTNHTYFFREKEVLSSVCSEILPLYFDRPHIRIWSAASSTGEEVYSLAMLAAEAHGITVLDKLRLLGTDISEQVIARAEAATFSRNRLEGVGDDLVKKYFVQQESGLFTPARKIRNSCTFRRLNLFAPTYPFEHKFPIIMCRNLFYYFDREKQLELLKALYHAVEPGGWLITSVTEAVRDLNSPWQQIAPGVYRRPS